MKTTLITSAIAFALMGSMAYADRLRDRVDGIENRVNTHSTYIRTLGARTTSVETDVEHYRSIMMEVSRETRGNTNKLNGLGATVGQNTSAIVTQGKNINDLANSLAITNSVTNSLKKQADLNTANITVIGQGVADATTKANKAEGKADAANTTAGRALEVAGNAQAKANIANKKADRNAKEIIKTNTKVEKNTKDIQKNASDIAANAAGVKKNSEEIIKTNTKVEKNTKDIQKNASDIAETKKNVARNAAAIAGHDKRITGLEGRTSALEGRVSKIERHNKKQDNAIAALAAQDSIDFTHNQGCGVGGGVGFYKDKTGVAGAVQCAFPSKSKGNYRGMHLKGHVSHAGGETMGGVGGVLVFDNLTSFLYDVNDN